MGGLINSRLSTLLNGSNERVNFNGADFSFERTDSFSLWAWARTASATTQDIWGKFDTATSRGYVMFIQNTGEFAVTIGNGAAVRIALTSTSTAMADGNFHLFAFTYDGSSTAAGTKMFVDGLEVARTVVQDTLNATIVNGSAIPTIGARDSQAVNNFNGHIDDVGIIKRVLTPTEILTIWNGGLPTYFRDLPFYGEVSAGDMWDGSDNQQDPWHSLFDRVNGALVGLDATNYEPVVPFRRHLNLLSTIFDGTDDHISLGDVHEFERTDSFSFEFWIKSSSATEQAALSKINAGAGYEVTLDASGSFHLRLVNTATTNELDVRTTATGFADGAWHHVVVTYAGTSAPSGVRIWVDNTDHTLTTVTNNLSASILNNDALRFGATPANTKRVTGRMCQMAFYNKVLVSGEISALFVNGPVNKAPLATWTSMVGWWPLGAGDTAANAIDRSHFLLGNRNGTTAGSPVLAGDAPTGGGNLFANMSLVLDGVSQYVSIGNVHDFTHTSTFSLECWFKSQTAAEVAIIAKRSTAGYAAFLTATGSIRVRLTNTATTNEIDVTTTIGEFDDGDWHHLVVTYNGSQNASGLLIYVDEVSMAKTVTTNNLNATISTATALQFGAQNAAAFFPGRIADVAIYNSVLNQAAVSEHINSDFAREVGKPANRWAFTTSANLIGWWPFGFGDFGVPVTKLSDFSVNRNHGTLTGTDAGVGQLISEGPNGNSQGLAGGNGVVGALRTTLLNDGLGPMPETQLRTDIQTIPPGGGAIEYFLMRGVDDDSSTYTTWIVTGTPDPDGERATPLNTTPTLVGNIVAESGIVLTAWIQ